MAAIAVAPNWLLTTKADRQCRALADRHYTRQTPGHPQWCRPGYNMVLWAADGHGEASFVWFRPKWESGIPGTKRKDGLEALECTLFRNETRLLSSDLIREACRVVLTWERLTVPIPDGLITRVSSGATRRRRSKHHQPGWCFIQAGWEPVERTTGRADTWLHIDSLSSGSPLTASPKP